MVSGLTLWCMNKEVKLVMVNNFFLLWMHALCTSITMEKEFHICVVLANISSFKYELIVQQLSVLQDAKAFRIQASNTTKRVRKINKIHVNNKKPNEVPCIFNGWHLWCWEHIFLPSLFKKTEISLRNIIPGCCSAKDTKSCPLLCRCKDYNIISSMA